MESGCIEEMQDVARAIEGDDKIIILKIISAEVLINENGRCVKLLEERDKLVKFLFNL